MDEGCMLPRNATPASTVWQSRRMMERLIASTTPRKHKSRAPLRRDIAAVVGARIRSVRSGKGISQAELGAPYFTRAHVSAIELGKVLPGLATLSHFARKLGVRVREFLPPDL